MPNVSPESGDSLPQPSSSQELISSSADALSWKELWETILKSPHPRTSSEFHTWFGLPELDPDMLNTYFSENRDRKTFDASEMELPHLPQAVDLLADGMSKTLHSQSLDIDKFDPVSPRILELGAGGAVSPKVLERIEGYLESHPGCVIDFLDLDPRALESLRAQISHRPSLRKHLHQFRFIRGNFLRLLDNPESHARYRMVYSELFHHHVFYWNGKSLGSLFDHVVEPGGSVFELDEAVEDFDTEQERIANTFALHQAVFRLLSQDHAGLIQDELQSLHDAMQPRPRNERIERAFEDPVHLNRLVKFLRDHFHDLRCNVVAHHLLSQSQDDLPFSTLKEGINYLGSHPGLLQEHADAVGQQWLFLPSDTLVSLRISPNGKKNRSTLGRGLLVKFDPDNSHLYRFYLREPQGTHYRNFEQCYLGRSKRHIFFFNGRKEAGKYEVDCMQDDAYSLKEIGFGAIHEHKRGLRRIRDDQGLTKKRFGFTEVSLKTFPFSSSGHVSVEPTQGCIYVQKLSRKRGSLEHPSELMGHLLSALKAFHKSLTSFIDRFGADKIPSNTLDFLDKYSASFGSSLRVLFPSSVRDEDDSLISEGMDDFFLRAQGEVDAYTSEHISSTGVGVHEVEGQVKNCLSAAKSGSLSFGQFISAFHLLHSLLLQPSFNFRDGAVYYEEKGKPPRAILTLDGMFNFLMLANRFSHFFFDASSKLTSLADRALRGRDDLDNGLQSFSEDGYFPVDELSCDHIVVEKGKFESGKDRGDLVINTVRQNLIDLLFQRTSIAGFDDFYTKRLAEYRAADKKLRSSMPDESSTTVLSSGSLNEEQMLATIDRDIVQPALTAFLITLLRDNNRIHGTLCFTFIYMLKRLQDISSDGIPSLLGVHLSHRIIRLTEDAESRVIQIMHGKIYLSDSHADLTSADTATLRPLELDPKNVFDLRKDV